MPYSMEEFADQIRSKFPAYASWPTDHLVSEVVTKHPEYQSWVMLDPRTAIEARKANPPATKYGSPTNADISTGDVVGAGVKGLAHLAGIPTSMDEVRGMLPDSIGEAAKSYALNAATMGIYSGTKRGAHMLEGAVNDAAQGHIPVIGRPLEALAAPVAAVAHGNAPSRDERLAGIEAGTSLAGMAAMAPSRVTEGIAAKVPEAGAGMVESGTKSYADALAPEGTANRPLAETLGSQLAGEGKVMSNPKKQLEQAFGGTEDITFRMDKATNSLKDLQSKYPNDTITEDGGEYVVHQKNEGQLNQQNANKLAGSMLTPEAQAWWKGAAKFFVRGGIGSTVGAAVGGPVGAAIGATVAEAPALMSAIVKSPLWKTTSGVVKTSLGKAMQAQDFATVTGIGARILGGVNLDDAYGHDAALFNLMKSVPPDADLHDYDAIYVNADGSHVPVPFHVQKVTKDALSGRR